MLASFDMVFLNCGVADVEFSNVATNAGAVDNIRQYVAEGGSIYASDWAYSIVEAAFPDHIDFVGNDAQTGAAKQGNAASALLGTIEDATLAARIGSANIEIHYPLPSWVVIEAVAGDVDVYVRADAPLNSGSALTDVPHTVGFNHADGRVVFTTFHQEPGISLAQEQLLRELMFEL